MQKNQKENTLEEKPLILVVNDDGVNAKGIRALGKIASQFGRVVMIAPSNGRSGMSHAVTFTSPLRLRKIYDAPDFEIYRTNGTPVDSVKLAQRHILKNQKIDLLLSGINQGSNTSVSVIYSATVAAAIEGCLNGIPSIAFSVANYAPDCNFDMAIPAIELIIQSVLKNSLPSQVCLSVNIPNVSAEEIKGIKITRQANNYWLEDIEERADPFHNQYFWISGHMHEADKGINTDQWAVKHKYISVHPIKTDLTDYEMMQTLKKWKLKI
jgi:5'-nucleotidase